MWPSDQTRSSSTNSSSLTSSNLYPEEPTFLNSHPISRSIRSLAPPADHLNTHVATLGSLNSYTSSLVLTTNFVYTGSSNGEIRLWKKGNDPSNPDPNYKYAGTVSAGKGAIKALVISSDNKLISAHQDHKIRIWKIDHSDQYHKIAQTATLPTLGDRVLKLLVPRNRNQIRRHDKRTWVHHVDTVSALALSSDESLLYSVSWDRTLKIWRTTDFQCMESVAHAHDDAINAITLSEKGHIYTASSDKKIKVWEQNPEGKALSLVYTLEKHSSGINALASSRDGSVLYSGASDGLILVWADAGSGGMEVVGALRGHTKSTLCLAVVLELVISGSADNTVRIWRGVGKSYSCVGVLEGHKGPVKGIAASSDRCSTDGMPMYMVYSASLDCDIKVWKVFLRMY